MMSSRWIWIASLVTLLLAKAHMASTTGLGSNVFNPAVLDAAQLQEINHRHEGERALVFTETREFPIRRTGLPTRWLPQTQSARAAFSGQARPGEFYVFQIGVYGLKDTGPLAVTFSDLAGGTGTIPASAWRCLSLGGIDYEGKPFAKEISIMRGQLQALWVGVAVPTTAQGLFTGTAKVRVAPDTTIPVGVTLKVEGPPAADSGDSVARNLSRLRWLDSSVGSEKTLTQPFIPVQTEARVIKVLGRELALSDDGLPEHVTSHFSAANTRIEDSAREVLAGAARFVVETGGSPVSWQSVFGRLARTDLEATWTARSTADGLHIETSGRLDYTGSGEVRVRLVADRDIDLNDARLEVPFREDAAHYFMGLNQQGGQCPSGLRWKWDVKKRQDCFWLGDVNAGLMLRFKDADYERPPVNVYYSFRPLRLPKSWGNDGRGGVDLAASKGERVLVRAYSGPRSLKKGDVLDFIFELYLTPFRTLDTEKQWATRFIHPTGRNRRELDDAVTNADAQHGPNVLNVHQANFYAPYINYPYSDDSFPAFCDLVQRAHAKGVKLRVYYTTREITQNMPELFPLHSFNGEIILPGPGPAART
ncbi:MAG: glycoside hydrolase domain-containing protein, partial [Verrucomicrobiota bacterium]